MFVAAALVWVGFVAAKLVFPDRQFMRLSVPLLLAVWPQTAFYSIQSDVLSPLCFGVAFVALIKFLQAEQPTLYLALLLGLALAATCLVKFGNVPLLAVALGAATFKVRKLARTRRLPAIIGSLRLLMFSVTLPIALCFVWYVQTFGDLTATAAKIEFILPGNIRTLHLEDYCLLLLFPFFCFMPKRSMLCFLQSVDCRCGDWCLEESCSSSSFRKSFLVGPHSPVTTISFISTRLSKLTNGKRCHFELCHVERCRDISDYSPQTSRDPSLGMTNLLRDDNSE